MSLGENVKQKAALPAPRHSSLIRNRRGSCISLPLFLSLFVEAFTKIPHWKFVSFPNLTGWLASDIYWKVEWAKNKIGGKLAEQAGWHRVRDNSRPNGELQVPCQGKTGLALKVEAARTNK